MKLILATMITMILTSSCTNTVKATLAVPEPIPLYKRLSMQELVCLTKPTRDKVILLDKRRRTLRSILTGGSDEY